MAAENANTMILLKSANRDTFEVSLKIGKKILIVKAFVEDESFVPTTAIPLQNVNSSELALVIEYLNFHHGEVKPSENEAQEFDSNFLKNLSNKQLMDLLHAVDYLNVEDLLEFLLQTVANLIENKSVHFVRNLFGIVSDFTPEEEERLFQETAWAHEDVDPDV
ncbi:hypothetical protein RIF29_36549 [Crotalaria pallida]|uniref:SKP1-like protein n=1 Tax=Crotalaria pallida TaxID=3830 RepID=A0AAN9EBF4_CROPI